MTNSRTGRNISTSVMISSEQGLSLWTVISWFHRKWNTVLQISNHSSVMSNTRTKRIDVHLIPPYRRKSACVNMMQSFSWSILMQSMSFKSSGLKFATFILYRSDDVLSISTEIYISQNFEAQTHLLLFITPMSQPQITSMITSLEQDISIYLEGCYTWEK